jgi:hypothetical protein
LRIKPAARFQSETYAQRRHRERERFEFISSLPFDTAYVDTMARARTSICLANGLIGDAR